MPSLKDGSEATPEKHDDDTAMITNNSVSNIADQLATDIVGNVLGDNAEQAIPVKEPVPTIEISKPSIEADIDVDDAIARRYGEIIKQDSSEAVPIVTDDGQNNGHVTADASGEAAQQLPALVVEELGPMTSEELAVAESEGSSSGVIKEPESPARLIAENPAHEQSPAIVVTELPSFVYEKSADIIGEELAENILVEAQQSVVSSESPTGNADVSAESPAAAAEEIKTEELPAVTNEISTDAAAENASSIVESDMITETTTPAVAEDETSAVEQASSLVVSEELPAAEVEGSTAVNCKEPPAVTAVESTGEELSNTIVDESPAIITAESPAGVDQESKDVVEQLPVVELEESLPAAIEESSVAVIEVKVEESPAVAVTLEETPAIIAEQSPAAVVDNSPVAAAEEPEVDLIKESPVIVTEQKPADVVVDNSLVEKSPVAVIEGLPDLASVTEPLPATHESLPINSGTYEATKEEVEQSIDFIKAKLKTPSPPIAPPKSHRSAKVAKEAPKEVIKQQITTECPEVKEVTEDKNVSAEVVKEVPKTSNKAATPTTKDVHAATETPNAEVKQPVTDTIPPVPPMRKRKQLQVNDWRPPRQSLIEYIFGCFVPHK